MILSRPVYNYSNINTPSDNTNSLISLIIDDSSSNQFYFSNNFDHFVTKIKKILQVSKYSIKFPLNINEKLVDMLLFDK